MSVGTIQVVIADDQALLRGSFRVLLETAPGIEVVGEAGSGAECVEVVQRERPDVVLMDVQMPHLDGIEATRRICAATTADHASSAEGQSGGRVTRVLMLTMFDLDEYVFAALRAGASGFLLKDTAPGELLAAIRLIAEGESLLAPSVTRRLIAEFVRRPPAPGGPGRPGMLEGTGIRRDLATLTERERDVLTLIAGGLSNSEIAGHLHVGVGTVKTHITRLLAKLEARDRAQLVIAAYETGLVAPAA
jgi:DNA-binding NarL/FixJ family response regulator